MLLNSDNGLCDSNMFYRTCGQTLQVRTEIPKDRVIEGTGTDHIQISNNIFKECNSGGRGDVITIESMLNDKHAENTPLSDIKITGNEFSSCYQAVIEADNVNGLTITDNIFRNCEDNVIGEHCKNVTAKLNKFLPKGDANADGKFTVSDAVLMKNLLLSVKDIELIDVQSADVSGDDMINIVDLIIMKSMLISELK